MAINQEKKAVEMMRRVVQLAETFMVTLEELQGEANTLVSSGMTLSSFDAAYAADNAIKHTDGATVTNLLGNLVNGAGSPPGLMKFMADNSYDDIFNQVRP